MPRKIAKPEVAETGFNFEELAELIVKELGGVGETAKLITEGAKTSESPYTREKYLTLITRLLKQALPNQKATDGLTDEEIDLALTAEIMRHFVSMDEDEYRGTIAQIEKARAGESQGPDQRSEESRETVPADDPAGSGGASQPDAEQHHSPLQATPATPDDWAASFDRPIDGGEQPASP